ncbi:MAG: hypothetical protein QOJ03_470 [Frankiaceae bacterium]|nr:hypothetical protein [Frankiaceae bacterium]
MIRRRHVRALLCAALLAMLNAPAFAGSEAAHLHHEDSAGAPLQIIGHLPEPKDRVYDGGQIAYVDTPGRRLYLKYIDPNLQDHLVTYDLRPQIPKPIADGVIGPDSISGGLVSPYDQTTLDPRRQHLLMVTGNTEVAGQTPPLGNPRITVFDLDKNRTATRWDLSTELPGFYPFGMTYSTADDRVYLVGDFTATSSSEIPFLKPASPASTVVALDPRTGAVIWVRPIPQCQQPMFSSGIGGLVVRSHFRPAIYFACMTAGTPSGQPYPGEAGLVRLNIQPHADQSEALRFPVDFFPIAGQYFNGAATGIATFDYPDDRFLLQSLSPRTPGAWVFDGRISSWVGFVSAPYYSDQFAGFNQRLGHLYMGLRIGATQDSRDGMVIADLHQIPVPAGSFQPIVTEALIPTDAQSRRLFILPGGASATHEPYLIARDMTPKRAAPSPLDYDALTDGVPESKAAFVSYSADANAYGADLVLVGGLAGPVSVTGNQTVDLPVAGGSRGVVLAKISGLGLRPAGASASAQSTTADLNTTKDYETNGSLGAWPYSAVSCLDSGGGIKPQSTTTNGAESRVDCSLADAIAKGSSEAAAATLGLVHVGHAETSGITHRDLGHGATTQVRARSAGIVVDVPGVGTLRIGSVTASLTTGAHGMTGTSSATYRRVISGLEIDDPKGKTLLGPSACATTVSTAGGHKPVVKDTCGSVARQVNALTQTRLHLGLPLPEATASVRGAYSTIQQTDADYYQERTVDDQGVVYPHDSTAQRPMPALQLVVYNDSTERSRVLAQFAAVQGDSIFDTSAEQTTPGGGPPPGSVPTGHQPGTPPTTASVPPADVSPGDTTTTVPPPITAPTIATPRTGLTGWLLLHRSLRDALLLAGILAIAAGAGVLAARRHQLLLAMSAPTERHRT